MYISLSLIIIKISKLKIYRLDMTDKGMIVKSLENKIAIEISNRNME